jgi:hypothetical protein
VKAEPTHSVHKLHPTPTSSIVKPHTPSVESHVVTPTHAAMSFPAPKVSQGPVAPPAPAVSEPAMPSASHGLIHGAAKSSSSATPTSSATPSPSASAPAGPLGNLFEGLPLVGGLVGAPLAGLGLRR